MRIPVFVGTILTVLWLASLSCGPRIVAAKHRFYRMDMPIEVTLVVPGDRAVDPVWRSIDSLLAYWEVRYSNSSSASEVKRLNERTSDTVAVSRELGEMIADAVRFGDSLGGDFDFTILPIKELWGLGEQSTGEEPAPGDSLVAATVAKIGYRKVRVTPGLDTVMFASRDLRIDLGGVAKGYALRDLGRLLGAAGLHDYLVAGGDVIARGRRVDGNPWRIGIQHPRADSLQTKVHLDSGVIFTSGDYERFRMINGRRVHHIFNPRTGYSCTNNQSVTLWGMDPIALKFYSTGLFCRPADSIVAVVDRRGDMACLVVDSAGMVHESGGWGRSLQ